MAARERIKTEKLAILAETGSGERVIKITFPYNFSLHQRVGTLDGARFVRNVPCWVAKVSLESIRKLEEWGFILSNTLFDILREAGTERDNLAKSIPGFKGVLYPYQSAGVQFIERRNGRALIADEMGLGKTIQALAWLQMHPELRPALVIAPKSLKINWQREAERWMTNPDVEILYGTTPYDARGSILIINYDLLHAWMHELRSMNLKVIVMDECHNVKNNAARRTRAMKLISKNVDHIIALSGTPVINRPIEMYNTIHMIRHDLFTSRQAFADRYCKPTFTRHGWDFSGSERPQELHNILVTSIMIRRKKSEVLRDLPPKVYSFVPFKLAHNGEYRAAEQDFIKYLQETHGDEHAEKAKRAIFLVQIETMKQLVVKEKLTAVCEWIEDFLEVENKLVLFTTHRATVDYLMNKFPSISVKHDGASSDTQKDEAVTRFQNDPSVRLFIGNVKSAGEGITLTASSNVAFVELPWTAKELDQCADRCHRIGQKDTVNVYYLLAEDTIEDRIAKIIDRKRKITDALLDGKESERDTLLSEIIKSYRDGTNTKT